MKPINMVTVGIVIVNYRTIFDTLNCLESLSKCELTSGFQVKVCVVDNHSQDESVQLLQQRIESRQWNHWVSVVALNANLGFGAGNNRGADYFLEKTVKNTTTVQYILLLNPDTIAHPNSLQSLVDFIIKNPSAKIVGAQLTSQDGTIQTSAFRFPGLLSEFENNCELGVVSKLLRSFRIVYPPSTQSRRVDWIAGACMLMSGETWVSLGGFDEKFFLYYEEVDLCRRAMELGLETWYFPGSKFVHLEGQSTGITVRVRQKRRPAYWFLSRKFYFEKNYGKVYRLLADFMFLAGSAIAGFKRAVLRRESATPPLFFRDFLRHSLGLYRS